MSSPLRAVLFDIDDTIADFSSADRLGILAHLAAVAPGRPAGEPAVAEWRRLLDVHFARYVSGSITFREQRRERARAMADWIGAPLASDTPAADSDTETDADRWFAGYLDRYQVELRLFDDVLPCLDALSGYRLGAMSNSESALQRAKLERLGVGDRFDCVVGTDTAGCAKPDPGIFYAACDALGVAPDETAYVGDRPDVDATAAAEAGLFGVWLDRSGPGVNGSGPCGPPQAGKTRRIASLAELPGLLAG
jgi:putative hydrolase of the HAD superfamily